MITDPVPVQVSGWTYSATIGVIQLIMGTLFGGGVLWTTARAVALLWQRRNESRQQDINEAAEIRKEMLAMSARQNERVSKLENDVRDERKRCDDEVSDMRKEHAKEIADMRQFHAKEIADIRLTHADEVRSLTNRIDGLHNQMVQMQRSTGSLIEVAASAPKATEKMLADQAGISGNLRKAFSGEGTDK